MSDVHKHRCKSCGTIWEHERSTMPDSDSYDVGHACPSCGESCMTEESLWSYVLGGSGKACSRYDGALQPTFFNHHLEPWEIETMSMHKHECPACETVWQHDPKTFRAADRPHVCPKCGHIGLPSTHIYTGPKPAEFTNHHLQAQPAEAV